MAISIKTPADIEGMRTAGRLASEALDILTPHVKAGVTTLELDKIVHDHIVHVQGGIPATLGYGPPGYPPYPASLCSSLNDVVCHGIPDTRPLKDGDIINIDVTVIKDGWHGDNSRMFVVGEGSIAAKRLCAATYVAMWRGISKVNRAPTLATLVTPFKRLPRTKAFPWFESFVGMALGPNSMKNRRCCTTAAQARWRKCCPA